MKKLLSIITLSILPLSAQAELVFNMDFNGTVTENVTGTEAEIRGAAASLDELSFVADRHGNVGGALDFNDNWLYLNNNNITNNLNSYTLSFWANLDYYRYYRDYFFDTRLGGGTGGLAMFYDMDNATSGSLEAYRASGKTGASLQNNGWQQITLTYDDSTSSGGLFINGVLMDNTIINTPLNPFNHLIIGHYFKENGYYTYAGSMDDFRVYDTSSTSEEIESLYLQESVNAYDAGVTSVNTPAAFSSLLLAGFLWLRRRT